MEGVNEKERKYIERTKSTNSDMLPHKINEFISAFTNMRKAETDSRTQPFPTNEVTHVRTHTRERAKTELSV